jgi:integrase
LPVGLKVLDTTTVGDILFRYGQEMTPKKRGSVREGMAIRVLLRAEIAKVPLSVLTVAKVAHYRDRRLLVVKPSTVCREILLYQHAFKIARNVWGIPIPENPFALVEKPRVSDARTRRLEPGEWEILKGACRRSRNPYILTMIEFAIETAMRRGEVLRLRWCDVDTTKRTLHIPKAKNGHARTIPLTARAVELLDAQRPEGVARTTEVFPTTEDAVKMAWRRVMIRAPLPNFRYHDLRHEAISRFFELGLSVPEVALISGHRDIKMLFRYTHLRPEDVALKLTKLTNRR